MDDFYPPLPEGAAWQLEIIIRNAKEDPDYLLDSPYSHEDLEALTRLIGEIEVALDAEDEDVEIGDKWLRLERESNSLFKELVGFKANLNERDNAERMSYFRTATSLLDKIVGIQERAANLKQIHHFHDTVLSVMEDILDADQRTEVLDRLRRAIQPEA